MPAGKIQDEQEVIRWFKEGRTYQWMTDEYARKYHIETVPSMWSNFRRRRGLDHRINRDDELIPWHVLPEHRWKYPVQMLRTEGRRRAGYELRELDQKQLPAWLSFLAENDVVVHYDPDLPEGFVYVPREAQDTDIVREPNRKTTKRRASTS